MTWLPKAYTIITYIVSFNFKKFKNNLMKDHTGKISNFWQKKEKKSTKKYK